MTGNGSGRFCPRMAERGNGGVAHGTHGRHGIGDGNRRGVARELREGTRMEETGIGRGARTRNGKRRTITRTMNENDRGRKRGPRNTRNTRKNRKGRIGVEVKVKNRGTNFFTTKDTKDTKCRGRGLERGPWITRRDAKGGRRVREVGVALRERRETCGVAAMKREFFRWGGVVAD